jgi:branched-chain amino acid transport system substrate-binding protein
VKLRRLGAVLACATIVAVGLAACGGDDDDDGGTSAATSTAPAPQGPPIKVGGMVSSSGAQKAVLGGTGTVLEAWAEHVNNTGGLNGHPVEITVLDDGGDPAKALQNAKQLVEQDDVMAIVGFISLADAAVAQYLDQQGIPVVGGGPLQTFIQDPNWFASGANLVSLTYGTVDVAKKAGKSNLGVMYCAESPVCAQLVPLAQGIGQLVGIDITPLKISATAPNYTAPCLQMKDSGVDALYIADNGPIIQRVLASCAQQNYDPLSVGQATTSTNDYLSDTNLSGALSAGTNANPYDDSLPAVAEFRDAVDSFQDGFTDSDEFTYDAFLPWTGGLLFEAAAKAGKLGPDSTPDDVKQAIYKLKNETLEGTSGTLVFTPGQPTGTPCWFTEKIDSGDLVSENGNQPTCLTAEQGAALQKALGG